VDFLKKYGLLDAPSKPESKMTHEEEVLEEDELEHLVDARRS
jgi:hypothetical protein